MVYVLHAKPIHGHYPKIDWGEGDMPEAKMIEPPRDGMPKIGPEKSGVPVDGSMLPTRLVWDEDRAHPPGDFDSGPHMNLSERAKAVIESVEPGVHQFFPVEYFWGDGEKIETRYWLYICNRRDSVCAEKSNWVLNSLGYYSTAQDTIDFGWDIPQHVNVDAPAKFVFEQAKIGDAHLWREGRAGGLPLMSEAMYQAIIDAGLTGFSPSDKKEVI